MWRTHRRSVVSLRLAAVAFVALLVAAADPAASAASLPRLTATVSVGPGLVLTAHGSVGRGSDTRAGKRGMWIVELQELEGHDWQTLSVGALATHGATSRFDFTWRASVTQKETVKLRARLTGAAGIVLGTAAVQRLVLSPTSAPPAPDIKAISAGASEACALLSSGGVDCWGYNQYGQLGDGSFTGPEICDQGYGCSTTPVAVTGISDATQISVGGFDACAVLSTGGIDCWGEGDFGVLGDGTATGPDVCAGGAACSTTPVAVSGITTAVQVAAGGIETCALLRGGSVECWGDADNGRLGDGSSTGPDTCDGVTMDCNTTPVAVQGLAPASQIAVDSDSACAIVKGLRNSQPVYCWGDGNTGELGNGVFGSSSVPLPVESGVISTTQIAADGTGGLDDACALTGGGGVSCWGWNGEGQLGDGPFTGPSSACGSQGCSATPVPEGGISGVTQFSAGASEICMLLGGGSVDCTGANDNGGLGIGTVSGPQTCANGAACSTTPLAVHALANVTQVSVGGAVVCALQSGSTVECWGGIEPGVGRGEIGDGDMGGTDLPATVGPFPS